MIEINSILAPTDFSEPSRNALRYAVAFAEEFGAPLHLFHSMNHTNEFGFGGVPAAELYDDVREKVAAEMEELHAMWRDYNFPVVREIRIGNPFAEIVRYANEKSIDLIVMGTHGRGALAHALLGNVAEKVVRKAPCPVLTVRHPEHEFVLP